MKERKELKVVREDDNEKTVLIEDPETGEMVESKTYYYHCDHGFAAWQQRSVDPAAKIKCPLSGCDKLLVPGKAPKAVGKIVKGHQ